MLRLWDHITAACKWTIAPVLFLFLSITTHSQPKCKVEYYSTEHGLSHQRVNCMLRDQEGFMWFGSWNGVHRFDGHSFISYKSYPGDRSQLGNDRIDQVVEDKAGHLWIEAYDQHIYRFDKRTEQFTPLSNIVNLGNHQKTSFTKILFIDKNELWLQSDKQGIFCVYPNENRFIQYSKGASADYALPYDSLIFFYKDRDMIWIGTANGLSCLAQSPAGD